MAYCSTHKQTECDSCLESGEHVLATGHSKNPDWSGYDLCRGCKREYDSRPPIGMVCRIESKARKGKRGK